MSYYQRLQLQNFEQIIPQICPTSKYKRRLELKIGFVTVYVADFKKSLDFYTKTLELEIDYTDDKNWAAFKAGR